MSAQDEAVQLLNEQSARNARFVELLTRVLDNFDEAQLGFNALLLVPVQRLPRYLLLLKGASSCCRSAIQLHVLLSSAY